MTIILGILALLGIVALIFVVRHVLLAFNSRLDTLEQQMNVLLPPLR